jgi:hypothetical protein
MAMKYILIAASLLVLTMVAGPVTQANALPQECRFGRTSFSPGDFILPGNTGWVFVCTDSGWKKWFNVNSDGEIPPMPQ